MHDEIVCVTERVGSSAMELNGRSESVEEPPSYKYCDLVMKGGITSGVIYPAAAVKLSEEYRFKNIGGTSAGAIAAAVTAAAELGRRGKNSNSFKVLAELPDELARNGQLLKLFTPDRSTKKPYHLALGFIGNRTLTGKIIHSVAGVVLASLPWFLLSLAIGLVSPSLFYCAARWHSLQPVAALIVRHPFICIASGLLVGLPLGFASALAAGVLSTIRSVAANGFGLCSGMAAQKGSDSLTGWIHQQIQSAAGRKKGDKPVTFGDLWTAPAYDGETLSTERTIDLKVVTTGLSEGRPFTIPFIGGALYFDPVDFATLFPADVVQWLIAKGEAAEESAHPRLSDASSHTKIRPVVSPLDDKTPLVRLAGNTDLPILVATRMSLSFPGLLSAVPLYRVDYRLARNQDEDNDTRVGTKVWFSDGGICSNFPLNFFDTPLPRWPTFGLNLLQARSGACTAGSPRNAADFVTLPKPVGAGPMVWNWLGDAFRGASDELVEERSAASCVGRFIASIINTMQNWQDNLHAASPGYRDRIVSVRLCPDEGGLNLDMPEDLITSLSQRGEKAAELLLSEFDFSQHVFTRFRITLSALQEYLKNLVSAHSNPLPQDDLGWSYMNGSKKAPHYAWSHENIQARAAKAIQDLLDLSDLWKNSLKEREGFSTDSPRPRADLKGRPDF
jgi:predicted acylesterase/phospholipase RssA